jgi:phosphatidylglycerol---prolipoprotein diacylglyceryl transferase
VPLGVVTAAFDPVVRLTETSSVRLETIALAGVLFLGLLLAARIGSLTPAVGPYVPAPGLRIDDLVFIVVGAVPGAIAGGRLGYVLDHLAFYQANPAAVLDVGQGGLSLTLAVPAGILTGAFIGRLLGAPVARWLHAAALPVLFVLGAGKMVGVLGASGQGAPSDAPWATAYLGPGPWGSLAADVPSHPAQVYEARWRSSS